MPCMLWHHARYLHPTVSQVPAFVFVIIVL
ncbi:hypothetical protein SNOG_03574 [Parastagonospora nodorum SN15]|uniref:Uncharacterized protein n=1 Tax=Phaeosphaeria nodorum (strain SN15 / ATCC MYA-4574 / FGSC 10173) TaxID=321614 RepID=Q0UXE0_PHANO|nr:hypothetical protein SNOG_03574 [Parastagonospora nodorum SN15]EAT88779.1 hypothetical protein SNOG_03574 [Parastagonospora nodorum SN15]